jgi:predicted dinucleotide-binding enzyme
MWQAIDGALPQFEGSDLPSSSIIQNALPATTRLAKTFNHLGYHYMEDLAHPADDPERIALGVASDNTALHVAAPLILVVVGVGAFLRLRNAARGVPHK